MPLRYSGKCWSRRKQNCRYKISLWNAPTKTVNAFTHSHHHLQVHVPPLTNLNDCLTGLEGGALKEPDVIIGGADWKCQEESATSPDQNSARFGQNILLNFFNCFFCNLSFTFVINWLNNFSLWVVWLSAAIGDVQWCAEPPVQDDVSLPLQEGTRSESVTDYVTAGEGVHLLFSDEYWKIQVVVS